MIKKRAFSLKNAVVGISWIFKTQPNFKIHLFFSAVAIFGALIFQISSSEFFIIVMLIGIGLAIEAINTSIEEAIDAIHKDWTEEIKVAKDTSAAAMLIFAISALVIAGIIFIPKILNLLISFTDI